MNPLALMALLVAWLAFLIESGEFIRAFLFRLLAACGVFPIFLGIMSVTAEGAGVMLLAGIVGPVVFVLFTGLLLAVGTFVASFIREGMRRKNYLFFCLALTAVYLPFAIMSV